MRSGSRYRFGRYAAFLAAVVLGVAVTPAAVAQAKPPASHPAIASELWGVSCASASACIAVGDEVTGASAQVALAERWTGTAWTVQSTPTPSGAMASYLDGVSCTSTSACTAVGHYVSSAGASVPLAERWNGTSWAVQATPNQSGATATFLDAVSCASASACTAIGYYLTGAGAFQTLAEAWNGTSWAIQATPAPTGSTGGFLLGVSCTAAAACTATGYFTTASTSLTLAERWNGTAWSIQSSATPSGSTGSQLYGVSCTSDAACTAVGNYDTATGVRALAERWNGIAWSVQSVAAPSDATAGYLNAVSCTAAAACTGVGWYETSPGASETLAETWNGAAWAIQPSPNPTGATASYLIAVSCSAAPFCIAAGYDLNPSYTALTERWSGTTWAIRSSATL
jgi:hypothetical protein